ncbi:DUF4390 domain-containing protein [Alcaligenaceae bacterium CGII-47]|nr:DUF4390 domain-containing protein [Alcaligenaceae bacterium CGII-47]
MLRTLLSIALCLFTLMQGVPAMAADYIERVDPVLNNGQLYIDADIEFELSPELRDAAQKGLPLYLTVDLNISHSRWWWFDKTIASTELTWRIQYNALTRQWRVGTGTLSLPASTLDEALALVRHVRGWDVAAASDLAADTQYSGRMRMRLDTSRLARPFQVDALNSAAWSLTTPWKNFTFSISDVDSQP